MKKYLLLALLPFSAMAQTYTDDVAEIINNNCVTCHRPGGVGPMSFETYDQVRPWAPLIQMRVANREMPPYAYDQHIGIQDLIVYFVEGLWSNEINTQKLFTFVSLLRHGIQVCRSSKL